MTQTREQVQRWPAWHAWLLAARPATLPASASGVVVGIGAALAGGAPIRLVAALLCLAVAVLLQVAANFANDLSDFRRGADRPDRLGPTRVVAGGLIGAGEVERGIAAVLVAAGLVGVALAVIGGPLILVVGARAVVATLAYTGGPWPYGYHALGEPFVFVYFGLVAVIGTAYLQTGRVEGLYVVAALPVGTLIAAILVVNNLRDIATDRAAGKRTLAVILGPTATRIELAALVSVAYLVPPALATTRGPAVLLPLVTLPLAVPVARAVARDVDPSRLNPVLGATARLTLFYSLAFAAGLALSR